MTTNRWDEIADELPDLPDPGEKKWDRLMKKIDGISADELREKVPETPTPDDRRDQYKKKIDRFFVDKIGEKRPGDLHRIFRRPAPEPEPEPEHPTPVVVQNPVSLGFKLGVGIFLANLVLGALVALIVYACYAGW